MASDRKPQSQSKESAQIVLNRFLKEHNILLGTKASDISTTSNGSIVIGPPLVIAVYAEDTKKQNLTTN